MTEQIPSKKPPQKKPSMWLDYGPIIAYVVTFNVARLYSPDNALYIGAAVFAVAVIIAMVYSKRVTGKISTMLWVTAVIVIGSAAITIGFQNKKVFYMKPTAINILFGTTIIGSLLMGKNIFKSLMGEVFQLPDAAWRTLAWRWGFFFLFLAGVNEYIWRNFSEVFWSNFKLAGMLPLTLVFTMLNLPLLMKHMTPPDTDKN